MTSYICIRKRVDLTPIRLDVQCRLVPTLFLPNSSPELQVHDGRQQPHEIDVNDGIGMDETLTSNVHYSYELAKQKGVYNFRTMKINVNLTVFEGY